MQCALVVIPSFEKHTVLTCASIPNMKTIKKNMALNAEGLAILLAAKGKVMKTIVSPAMQTGPNLKSCGGAPTHI